MAKELPLAWARKVDSALLEFDVIPLSGNAPRIDMSHIASTIAQHLKAPLSISVGESAWRDASMIKDNLGPNVMSLGICLTPLSGSAIWLMAREDVAKISSFLMNGKTRGQSISSEILQEGFYRYFAVQALDALQETEPLKTFSLKISDQTEFALDNSYCIDIKLSFEQRSCWGRLVLSPHLMTSWQRHFSSLREIFSLSPMAQSIEVPVSICTGHALLSAKEWKKIENGDFFLLDRGGYDPRHHEGAATLNLGSTPLFHVAIKENKIKLLDYAQFYEEIMEKPESKPVNPEGTLVNEESRAMAVKELPLIVTVELARLRMSVDQLMKLSAGNFLELPVRPDQEVSLTVNGQKVGRGELVFLGEALGIRILETA